jgi:hypothetical protein
MNGQTDSIFALKPIRASQSVKNLYNTLGWVLLLLTFYICLLIVSCVASLLILVATKRFLQNDRSILDADLFDTCKCNKFSL